MSDSEVMEAATPVDKGMSLAEGDMAVMNILADAIAGKKGDPIVESESVKFNVDPKDMAITLPLGMTFQRAKRIFQRLHDESETVTEFVKIFEYRVNDGLNAAAAVMKDHFGVSVGAKPSWFKQASQTEIEVAPGVKKMVPSGDIEIPHMDDAECYLGATHDAEYGHVFGMRINAKRKFEKDILALFEGIESYLQTDSIYRGQAVHGAEQLKFLDLSEVDRNRIVFTQQVEGQLEAGVWGYMRHTDAFVADGQQLKKSTLMHGPYGTGKSSAGQLTAMEAIANGWTFISADPSKDNIGDVLRTARLYQPAVVFMEDIDKEASAGDDDEVSSLLDAFDGITAKGGRLLMLMTTNHPERIHKGMWRPGRLDMVVEVDALDAESFERLIRSTVKPEQLAGDIDFNKVSEAMDGFQPAFVVGAINQSRSFAINAANGASDYVLTTESLVAAALALHPQLEMLREASEGNRRPTMDVAFEDATRKAVAGIDLLRGGSPIGQLAVRNGSS